MPEAPPLSPEAVAALQSHLGDRADPGKAREAARQLANHEQWLAAAGIMRNVLNLGSTALDDLIAYARYLACGGEVEAARGLIADAGRQLSALDGQQWEAIRGLARDYYAEAAIAFARGRQAEAEIIADLFMPHEPFGRRLLGLEVPVDDVPRPSALEEEVVADFIRGAIADSEAGKRVPAGAGSPRATYEQAFAPYRDRRVLIIHRDRYHPNPKSDPTPAPDYLLEGALEAGLQARVIRSEFACSVPAAAHPPTAAAEQAAIRETVETWKPEVVVYDAFGGTGRESMTECIRDLRRRLGFKLVGLFHDVWSDTIREIIGQASDDLDAIWYFDPMDTSPHMRHLARGVSTVPPIPERWFLEARERTKSSRNLGFIGSISVSNHIRGLWLTELRRRGIPIDVVLGYPYSDEAYRTIDSFAGFLASCKASLCICGRNAWEAAVPARVWEGIYAKSVLLEDDTDHMRHFLTPFAHYVPFRTVEELAFYADFLARRDDIREAIADHALAFVRETYPPVRIWLNVLDTAYRNDARAAAGAL